LILHVPSSKTAVRSRTTITSPVQTIIVRPGKSRRLSNRCGQVYNSPYETVTPFAGDFGNVRLAITIITVIAVISVINVRLAILSARWRKKRLQRSMIAQAELAEGVEVVRLRGAQRVGGKDMIEAMPDAVLITPAPSLVLRRFGVAMQPAKDIAEIIIIQPMQDAELKFMLTVIF